MKITIEVPDEVIERAIREARIAYWGTITRYVGAWIVTEHEPTAADRSENPDGYRVSSASLVAGLVLMASGAKTARHFADLMAGTGDSVTGDVLIQCAAFGELRYG